jgi:hypothetical protein
MPSLKHVLVRLRLVLLSYSSISVVSVAKPKIIVIFAFTYVLESFALFNGDFCMDLYSVNSYEAMKQGNEALKDSSLQF